MRFFRFLRCPLLDRVSLMSHNRFCVFCGEKPEKKNREHVLPQWLLELTGDPKRVVDFGINFENGDTIRFDWSNFCVPACEACNSEYSHLEGRAKSYVQRLLARSALTSYEYSDFLDWLDKVRIGVWIAYFFIQKNPTDINPKFHIKTRVGQKDRMIAIYPIAGCGKGLNAYGAESLIFHNQPSCFALRINDLLILNISSDYLFSGRCGFPFPKINFFMLDGYDANLMRLDDFSITRNIKHPLIRRFIAKPSIHLYQPIMPKLHGDGFQSGFLGLDSYLIKHTMPPYPSRKGVLFFQHQDHVEPIYDVEQKIKFERCTGIDSRSMYFLIKQVYELQNEIYLKTDFRANDKMLLRANIKYKKILIEFNKRMITHYSNMAKA